MPQVFNPGGAGGGAAANNPYYDRTPVGVVRSYDADAVAPHAATIRWSYTVPAGKRAYIESTWCNIFRQAGAAPSGMASATIRLTPSGGAANTVFGVHHDDPPSGFGSVVGAGQSGLMLAGDLLEGRTVDASTGGTFHYGVAARLIEFTP